MLAESPEVILPQKLDTNPSLKGRSVILNEEVPMSRRFSQAFKDEAVKLVEVNGVQIGQAASELGIGRSTLEKWLREYRHSESNGLAVSEKSELKQLREENRKLKLEKELLKKATVYFAKHSE